MVEYTYDLDDIFISLSDQTRRKILSLISYQAMTVGQIAGNFKLTYGAISKHILVLEKAKLIVKQRKGKEQIVSLSSVAIEQAEECLMAYRKVMEDRLGSLDR
jgi:DNA-binding transcriptional ArsR family regulator